MASLFAISYIPCDESGKETFQMVITIVGFTREMISQAVKVDFALIALQSKFQGVCTFTVTRWSRACKQIALISRPVSHFWA